MPNRNSEDKKAALGTRAVWAGENGPRWERATQVPVALGVSFSIRHHRRLARSRTGQSAPGHIYSRNTNPTVAAFEEKVRDVESAEAATSFASGMAAISNTLLTLLSPGDRVVTVKDTYGGTNKLFIEFLPRFGINVALCDTNDPDAIERSIRQGCKAVYLETPTNPTLKILDIRRLSTAAHREKAVVVVDSTLATPVNQQPLKLGADLVLHSATKFLGGGHADALGGIVCGNADLVTKDLSFSRDHRCQHSIPCPRIFFARHENPAPADRAPKSKCAQDRAFSRIPSPASPRSSIPA